MKLKSLMEAAQGGRVSLLNLSPEGCRSASLSVASPPDVGQAAPSSEPGMRIFMPDCYAGERCGCLGVLGGALTRCPTVQGAASQWRPVNHHRGSTVIPASRAKC